MRQGVLSELESIKKDRLNFESKPRKPRKRDEDITIKVIQGYMTLTDSVGNKLSINLSTNWVGYYEVRIDYWIDLIYQDGRWCSMSGESYTEDELPVEELKILLKKLMSSKYGENIRKKGKL